MDQQILSKIAQSFRELQCPMYLLEETGRCLVPQEHPGFKLPEALTPGEITRLDNMRYLRLSRHSLILAAHRDVSDDVLRLGSSMVDALMMLSSSRSGIMGAYQRMLLNELSVAELDAVLSEYRIAPDLHRCVLLMHMVQVQGQSAQSILTEMRVREM